MFKENLLLEPNKVQNLNWIEKFDEIFIFYVVLKAFCKCEIKSMAQSKLVCHKSRQSCKIINGKSVRILSMSK